MDEKVLNMKVTGSILDAKEYKCELTKDMNNYLLPEYKSEEDPGFALRSYLLSYKEDVYVIRVPGATRGYIKIDKNNVIIEVKFYDDNCFNKGWACFDKSLKEIENKYIGYKLIFEE